MDHEMRKKKKLVYGVGINDANYEVQPINPLTGKRVFCPFYKRWVSMLKRCYNEKCQERQPTYKGCTVCGEWLTFSNFKSWMQQQNWEGKQLDKDLLFEGNKIYSPETCVFVIRTLNNFVTDSSKARGDMLIGVCFYKPTNTFLSRCCNPVTKKRECLGYFKSELKAHRAWKAHKLELVDLLLEQGYIDDVRVYEALKLRYECMEEA